MRLRSLLLVGLFALLGPPAEAATTCSTIRKVCSTTASDGLWLQINLPPGTAYVLIEVSGASYVDGPGGTYTDGGARSSGGRAQASGEVFGLPIVEGASKAIWVAGNGASRTVTVMPLGAEAL